MARKLGRTHHAVSNKMSSCHISVFSNFYSARLLAAELGCNHHTVIRWHKLGWLKGRRADWRRIVAPMVFVEDDIVAFIKGHSGFFVGRKIPNVYFKNIVLDALPDSEPLTKKHIDNLSKVW